MHAVILAGGKGSRLKPYTTILPKPLMPIGEMPILEVVLRQLRAAGFRKITIAVGHLSELLQAFFGNGRRLGLEITYSLEEQPLGTAAPLKLIGDLPDSFLMMNGDLLTNIGYRAFFEFHRRGKAAMTIASFRRTVKVDFGVLECKPDGMLSGYREKPILDYRVSMGIYAMNREVLEYIPDGRYFDLPDLVQSLMAGGRHVGTYAFDGYWLDIGRLDDYERAVEEFEEKKWEFLPHERGGQ